MIELLRIGAQMANVMFNLAQRPGEALKPEVAAVMADLRKQWDAAVRATPPSPSTAPEVDERHEFERWMSQRGESAVYIGDGLYSTGAVCDQAEAFAAGIAVARAALASRPAEVGDASAKAGGQVGVAQAETRMDTGFQPVVPPAPKVDDEGMPPLPEPVDRLAQEDGFGVIGSADVFTAKQYRQGQRDAVAADRARRGGQL